MHEAIKIISSKYTQCVETSEPQDLFRAWDLQALQNGGGVSGSGKLGYLGGIYRLRYIHKLLYCPVIILNLVTLWLFG